MFSGIRGKLFFIGFVPIILFVLVTFIYILPSIEKDTMGEKEIQTKELVNVALSIIKRYHDLENIGLMSREEAQKEAIDMIRALRFGENKLDYFWINDLEPKMILHPFRPDLQGQNLSEIQDPDGFPIFLEMTEIAKKEGAGYVPYKWQYYAEDRIEPKVSYVALYEPWGWVVGTGVYVNDVNELVAEKRWIILSIIAVISILCVILAIVFSNRWFVKPIKNILDKVNKVAVGDLTGNPIKINSSKDELNELSKSFNLMFDNLKGLLKKINLSANLTSHAAQDLSKSAEHAGGTSQLIAENITEVASGAVEQSKYIKEIEDMIKETVLEIKEGTSNAQKTLQLANISTDLARVGEQAILDAISHLEQVQKKVENISSTINSLGKHSEQIDEIITVITSISDQTNLLALNAAIEAARAGEHGKGFAVVAEEVRKLAEESNQAAKEITDLIQNIQKEISETTRLMSENYQAIKEQVELINRGNTSFQQIVNQVEITENSVREMENIYSEIEKNASYIAESIQKISSIIQTAADAAEEVAAGSEEQSAMVEEINATTSELEQMARNLHDEVNKFKVDLATA